MDKNITDFLERSKSGSSGGGGGATAYVNGGMRRPCSMGSGRGAVLLEGGLTSPGNNSPASAYGQVLRVIVNRDERGYGMKVSGDKPVYVQSVKEGGAAEKAGLHADDKIIQVNGVDVMESTHTEVVALIRSSNQVVLTVQQKPRMMGSPSLHSRPMPIQSSTRITGPKPVDNEKLRQFHAERVQTFRLMLEEEQRYVDSLRSELARCPGDEKKLVELTNAEKNVATLQSQLQAILNNTETSSIPTTKTPQESGWLLQQNKYQQEWFDGDYMLFDVNEPSVSSMTYPCPSSPLSGSMTLPSKSSLAATSHKLPYSHSTSFTELPPPLPKRNNKITLPDSVSNASTTNLPTANTLAAMNAIFLDNEVNLNNQERNSNCENISGGPSINARTICEGDGSVMVQNNLYDSDIPPPLPPRVPVSGNNTDSEAVNSISKQMSYPLVATCATLYNNYPATTSAVSPTNHTHQRTKSSPDPLGTVLPFGGGDVTRRLVSSESLNDLSTSRTVADTSWDVTATPPGTPPPPYPSPLATKRHTQPSSASSNRNSTNTEDGDSFHDESLFELSPETSPLHGTSYTSVMATSSPIVAATPNTVQQPIISMEDDEISDQEVMEDHGPFKSLSRLWEHPPHLAVFMNYVLSNSDPSSLLFYLLTDLYKEGNAKDMRKWAYEIHSSFLVPGAPLRLSNVDENIAREIDDVLLREGDKEEILRKIFWKARNRAKEELNEQLADFQQKRTAGLGTIFGPPDARLDEISHDKAKEVKLYETLLLSKLEPYLDELEKDIAEPRRYITAAALATLITKLFGVRGMHSAALDRCPMFISKDKSFRTKLIGRYSRKLNVYGHHYVALHYFSVISCNNCHQIIYGIGPQGYQCSVCLINLHRQCVKQYDDLCPGPITKKDRGIGKFMERIRPESKDSRRKPSAYFISMEREKRLNEEKDSVPESDQFTCDRPPGQPVSRSSSDKRPDAVTEEASRVAADGHDAEVDTEVTHDNLSNVQRAKSSQPAINRSESYKEQSQKRRQIRERRKISDPNLSKSNDVDSDHQELSYHSGSSSNSSLSSSRSSESPQSTSLDIVHGTHGHSHHQHSHSSASSTLAAAANWDSDVDIEPDPPDWQSSVSEDVLARLHPEEKKRQEIINELFHTERSHVRNLKVLETVFYRPLLQNKCLPPDQVRLLFPNLEEMLDIHGTFNVTMKARRKEEAIIGDIGELLLNMFDGQAGETFKEAAAKFCARQQLALESLKEKRRKDPRLNSFLTDCESDKLCKRLQLKDIIPTGMQRLVKYPLLFESLARCTERVLDCTMTDSLPSSSPTNTPTLPQMGPTPTELVRLKRALERSKEILNYVNQAVKEAEDKARLQDIQKRLDKTGFEKIDNHPITSEFRNLDLTRHKLIHEGPLLWRINKQNKVSVHVVLLEEIILLLQKQDEKYILKFYTSASVVHSPIVKVSTVLVRHNATEKDSLYLVNTSQNGAQIYDLSAQSPIECKVWFKHISDAAEAYKSREGKSRRSELSTPESEATAAELACSGSGDLDTPTDTDSTSAENSARNSGVLDDEVAAATDKRLSQTDSITSDTSVLPTNTPPSNDVVASGGSSKREALMRLAGDDQPLIQPSEVTVNVLPVHTAQPVITPIEQVRRKDEAIRQALAEKEALVAEILHVPPEDYHTIVDMAGDVSGDKEPTELVLAAVNQANLLSSMVSESLNISEVSPVIAGSSGAVPCASTTSAPGVLPTIPSHRLHSVANALNTQLTALLRLVKEREEERERMRREMQKLREQLHNIHESHTQQAVSDADIFHSAGDLANIEEDP